MLTILLVSLLILLIASVPVAISVGLSSLIAIYFGSDLPLGVVAQHLFTSGFLSFNGNSFLYFCWNVNGARWNCKEAHPIC